MYDSKGLTINRSNIRLVLMFPALQYWADIIAPVHYRVTLSTRYFNRPIPQYNLGWKIGTY